YLGSIRRGSLHRLCRPDPQRETRKCNGACPLVGRYNILFCRRESKPALLQPRLASAAKTRGTVSTWGSRVFPKGEGGKSSSRFRLRQVVQGSNPKRIESSVAPATEKVRRLRASAEIFLGAMDSTVRLST